MAEKPILKKDRDLSDRASSGSPSNQNVSDRRPSGGDGRGKGRGKGRDQDKAPRAAVNPALMRGPKPVKQSAEPDQSAEAVVEVAADQAADTDVVADQVVEAAPEAAAEAAAETETPTESSSDNEAG